MRFGLPSWKESNEDDGLLDRIDVLRVLRADDSAKGAALEEVAALGAPEHDIVAELGAAEPLRHPDRFEAAHRSAMHALEVLDRNAPRRPVVPRVGPLTPLVATTVSLMTRLIARGHKNTLLRRILSLYSAREAASIAGTQERRMLRSARIQGEMMEGRFRERPFAIPTFLLGGVALSTVVSVLDDALRTAFGTTLGIIVVSLTIGTVLAGLAWCALYAAGVARRRIRLSTDRPMASLWDAIGSCGPPPADRSYHFALYGIALTVVAWIGVPLATWLLFG